MGAASLSSFLICKSRLFYRSPTCELKLPASATCHPKLPTLPKDFEPQRLILYIDNFKSKLWSVTPQPLQDFPFQDAKVVFLQQLLLTGKSALKSSLLVLHICSFVSLVVYSISKNKELMVLLGLFVGCVATNFLTEISKELFPFLEEKDVRQHLVGSCCIFFLIKIISTFFCGTRENIPVTRRRWWINAGGMVMEESSDDRKGAEKCQYRCIRHGSWLFSIFVERNIKRGHFDGFTRRRWFSFR